MPGYHRGKSDLWQILVIPLPTRLPTSLYLKKLATTQLGGLVFETWIDTIVDTRHEHHVWYQQSFVGEPWIPELL